jgi:hypothetical protein
MAVDLDAKSVADRLAAEIQAAKGGRTWRKATTLAELFGSRYLTGPRRARIAAALADAGIVCEPPIESVERYQTVRLSLRAADADEIEPTMGDQPAGVSNVTIWSAGSLPKPARLVQGPGMGGVLLVEVDQQTADATSLAAALGEVLAARGAGFDAPTDVVHLFADLLSRDGEPGRGPVDGVASLQKVVPALARAVDAGDSRPRLVRFDLLEIIAVGDVVLTCWHPEMADLPGGEPSGPLPSDEVPERAARLWSEYGGRSAADLGVCLLLAVVERYRRLFRYVELWIEEWESDFHRAVTDDVAIAGIGTLTELRAILADIRKHLVPLDVPRDRARYEWFPGVTSEELAHDADATIDQALGRVRTLADELRRLVDLTQSRQTLRQIELAQQQASRSELLQRRIENITAVLLVPTLVASIWGANTELPGRGSWGGFGIMLGVMVATGLVSWLALRVSRQRGFVGGGGSTG